tara:strand:- start:22 stop:246 length:225 start_codon:yes stop_codon:yes gene_type:complete
MHHFIDLPVQVDENSPCPITRIGVFGKDVSHRCCSVSLMSSDIKLDRSRTLASPSNRMIAENPEKTGMPVWWNW